MRRLAHLATALSVAACLMGASLGLAGCSSDAPSEEPPVTEKVEKAEEPEAAEEEAEAEQEEPEASEQDATADADADSASETQHVGADGVGFVDIPAQWKPFQDVDGGDDLQWCDGTPYTIVTLNIIDLTGQDRESLSLEDAANNIAYHLIDEGIDETTLNGAHVTLAGREAVQLYGMYPEGSTLVIWLLEDDAGNYRYVSAEGTTDTVMDAVGIVESSYEL